MTAAPLLKVQLRAGYPGKAILRNVQFELHRGEVLGLVGVSGAGKSTLVLALLGLLPWRGGNVSGEVLLEGQNLLRLTEGQFRHLRGSQIALIPQSPMTALNAAINLQRHFNQAWQAHKQRDQRALSARVTELLTQVHLPSERSFLAKYPYQLSVGQAQRVLIALALLHRPALIIADEPTSALDPITQTQIVQLLQDLNQQYGTSLLYISHDFISVLQLSDRIAVLADGNIVETLPVANVMSARHRTTQALLQALPVPADLLLKFRHRERKAAEHHYADFSSA